MNNLDSVITIFTPTFNRSKELETLYHSLVKQTCKKFVWLIVDDGSWDDTKEKVARWTEHATFRIQYIWQENQGKSRAHNVGVRNTKTELFSCVDSDDYLSYDAVEKIINCWEKCKEKSVGILAKRSVTRLNRKKRPKELYTTLRDSQRTYGILGDTMLIFKSKILCKYEFPRYENEKFVPENYLYDLMDQEGKLFFLDEILYYGEYLEDGYTKNMAALLKQNPNGYMAYINQRLSFDTKAADICFNTIRYIAMSKVLKDKKTIKNAQYPVIAAICYPAGLMMYKKRYK